MPVDGEPARRLPGAPPKSRVVVRVAQGANDGAGERGCGGLPRGALPRHAGHQPLRDPAHCKRHGWESDASRFDSHEPERLRPEARHRQQLRGSVESTKVARAQPAKEFRVHALPPGQLPQRISLRADVYDIFRNFTESIRTGKPVIDDLFANFRANLELEAIFHNFFTLTYS